MDYLAGVRFLHHVTNESAMGRAILAGHIVLTIVLASCGGGDEIMVPEMIDDGGEATATTAPAGPTPPPTIEALSSPTPIPSSPTPEPAKPSPTVSPTATAQIGPVTTDVRWHDGIRFVGGTLSTPPGGRLPAVLFVADGGGADRDWVSRSIPGLNGSGRLLSAALVEAGYATLRYDRRGTGRAAATTATASGENFLDDSVREVASGISYLRSRPEIDPERIYVIAHDEGVLHVLLYLDGNSETGIAGVAMLAPSALSLRQQVIRRLGQLAEGPEDEPVIGAFDAAMALFIEGGLPDEDLGFSPSMQGLFENLTHQSKLPYNAEIWNLSPVSLPGPEEVPTLMMFGQADSEVDWNLESEMWRDSFDADQNVEFVFPARADHVLKYSAEGATEAGLGSYNVFGRSLDADAVEALISWLDRHSTAS